MTNIVDNAANVPIDAPTDVPQAHADPQALGPCVEQWREQIREARERRSCIKVRGGGSKDHLGDTRRGELLDTTAWQGIVSYEPSELVITARASTPLALIEDELALRGQHLAFEPPRGRAATNAIGPGGIVGATGPSTLGGMVAAGFSGPSRAARGAVRDHVLGVRMLNGRAQALRFGGAVMKNVAGFDLSRLMVGSMGTLGVLTEVTLKVMPQAMASATLRFEMTQGQALQQVNQWAGQPLPLDASAWWDNVLVLRLRGAQAAVHAATQRLVNDAGGECIDADQATAFWSGLRDQNDEFFQRAHALVASAQREGPSLWRLSLPATTPALSLPGETLVEWFGAQRWLCTAASAAMVHEAAARAGGHALPWFTAMHSAAQLPPVLLRLHRQVQRAFDPDGVFDTGRLWPRASKS